MARTIGAVLGFLALGFVAVQTARLVEALVRPAAPEVLRPVVPTLLAAGLLYGAYRLLDLPLPGVARRVADEIDYRYRLARAKGELRRRIRALEEEGRVRALTASARVHEDAARAVADGKLQLELEELKGRSEEVVMRSQSAAMARALARYQAAFWKLKQAGHMTAGEKARLIEEIRGILAAEDLARRAPPAGEDELSLSAQPPIVLEYRAPGGHAIPVTVDGFRRLLERNQLGAADECRRLGSMDWIPVAEMLDDSGSLRSPAR